ncbi:radical SAM protein [Marinitoga aeolica]|uniref:Radical SAM protein n=1 Tax=Marinitoga aeolica TaxID=2809031 RepID=A0ABY8PSU4_9BACT|nr:radical SAM protein [Marinitoga aeolica]WGS65680.1 radical SAM protein [Marinitoga aeolica]
MFSENVEKIIKYIEKERKKEHHINLKKDFFAVNEIFGLLENTNLRTMAKKVMKNNRKFFGDVIFLYAPLYISNYCINGCTYCGFKATNKIQRKKLTYEKIEKESLYLKNAGIDHVLILTGEDPVTTDLDYLYNTIKLLKRFFKEVSIETYSLKEDEYKKLISAGLIGVTMYQETYCIKKYKEVHLFGPKSDYKKRLDTIEYAIKSGVREINIGALLGLYEPEFEIIMLAYHMDYLLKNYPEIEYAISFPRIKSAYNVKNNFYIIPDKQLIHYIIALKLIFPRVHINISTRENADFRNALIGIATKMSAGSTTNVGGYTIYKKSIKQFETEDKRNFQEFINYIKSRGYNPTTVNWF